MFGTYSYIKRLFLSAPKGVIITRRHCLAFGTEPAVDSAVHKLVRNRIIERIADGVFRLFEENAPPPSARDIARAKALVFDRRIAASGEEALARTLAVLPQERTEAESQDYFEFVTDGPSTSFNTIIGRIFFKHRAPRKIAKLDTPHGLVIRSLWEMGEDAVTPTMVMKTAGQLAKVELEKLRSCFMTMPGWLAQKVINAFNPVRPIALWDAKYGVAYSKGSPPKFLPEMLTPPPQCKTEAMRKVPPLPWAPNLKETDPIPPSPYFSWPPLECAKTATDTPSPKCESDTHGPLALNCLSFSEDALALDEQASSDDDGYDETITFFADEFCLDDFQT